MSAIIELSHRQNSDGTAAIFAIATCAMRGRQEANVAVVELHSRVNPLVRMLSPSGWQTLGMLEEICAYVRENFALAATGAEHEGGE